MGFGPAFGQDRRRKRLRMARRDFGRGDGDHRPRWRSLGLDQGDPVRDQGVDPVLGDELELEDGLAEVDLVFAAVSLDRQELCGGEDGVLDQEGAEDLLDGRGEAGDDGAGHRVVSADGLGRSPGVRRGAARPPSDREERLAGHPPGAEGPAAIVPDPRPEC